MRAITIEDIGYKIGHPYPTVDPTGRFVYVSVFAPPWREQLPASAVAATLGLAAWLVWTVTNGRMRGSRDVSRAEV